MPLFKIDGPNIVRALKLMYITKFGYCCQIICDNGLNSPELKDFCQVNGIQLTFLSVYSPQGNLQERLNGTLKSILAKTYHNIHREWDETILAMTLFLYNISVHSSIGFSPYYIFLGREPEIPFDLFLDTKNVNGGSQLEYLENLRSAIEKVTPNAYKAFERSINLNSRRNNFRNHEYFAGQKVLVRNFRKAGKLEPNFLNDFEIVRKTSPRAYLVKNNRTGRFSRVNIRDVKLDGSVINTPQEGANAPGDEDEAPQDEKDMAPEKQGNEAGQDGQPGGKDDGNRAQEGIGQGLEGRPKEQRVGPDGEPEAGDDGRRSPASLSEMDWDEIVREEPIRTRAGRVSKPPQRY